MLQTALHDWHAANGGRMVDFAGWSMPIQYSTITEEHAAVRERVGLFDIAHMGRIIFTGPDAEKFLDRLLTNDVTRLRVGQVRYSLVCNEQGGILDDVLVYRFEDRHMLVVNASNRDKIVSWIEEHRGGFDVQVDDQTTTTFMFAIQGPRSLDVLGPHASADLGAMKYYTVLDAEVFGKQATISRTGYTGEDGFEVIVSLTEGSEVWQSVLQSGAEAGIAPCGLGCRDTLRLEAAMPLYGHEMDERTDPITAGLSFGVKMDAGEFFGKSALKVISARTDLPVRVGLKLEGKRIAREGAIVRSENAAVGHITSGTFSPTLNEVIAMAYVPGDLSQPGTSVEVDIRGKCVAAEVVALPFYRRQK
ncbi:MAG: glycine cleavage system aminomethyltransferase GcvT [Planctomycetaceae bacterium]|nr:glycine cleavage system aminomethyltransferase GcvT [Planctomycetaceae bacterium]